MTKQATIDALNAANGTANTTTGGCAAGACAAETTAADAAGTCAGGTCTTDSAAGTTTADATAGPAADGTWYDSRWTEETDEATGNLIRTSTFGDKEIHFPAPSQRVEYYDAAGNYREKDAIAGTEDGVHGYYKDIQGNEGGYASWTENGVMKYTSWWQNVDGSHGSSNADGSS